MKVTSQRFGDIDCDASEVIKFPGGIIGFPNDKEFLLLKHGDSSSIGWLQSVTSPELSLPVVSAHGLMPEYPDVPIAPAAEAAGLAASEDDFAVMAVLCAQQGMPATINLLAPILIGSDSRQGAQVFLEGSRFTTRELFVMPQAILAGNDRTQAANEQESASEALAEAAP